MRRFLASPTISAGRASCRCAPSTSQEGPTTEGGVARRGNGAAATPGAHECGVWQHMARSPLVTQGSPSSDRLL